MGSEHVSGSFPDVLTLDPLAQAVATARQYVRSRLPHLGGDAVADNAELAVSELVTNATLHARTPMSVEVFRTDEGPIRISVRDRSSQVPAPRHYAVTATTGRGLRLVAAVSTRWGVDPVPAGEEPGKIVWCEPAADSAVVGEPYEWLDVIAELA